MESFSSYIPMDRRLALAQNSPLPEKCSGAVLFADISGFTSLTETLARTLGPHRGAEEITSYLNRVYGALIALVHQQGGSVINFSGDAITCWFDEMIRGVPTAVPPAHRATNCALAMQTTIAATTETAVRLQIKVAVALGTARRFLVGSPERQTIEVLAGTLLDRMALAETLVNQDEVIIDEGIVEAVGETLAIAAWRAAESGERFAIVTNQPQPEATPWPDYPIIPAPVARQWLQTAVSQRLQHSEDAFLAELRPAVSLFLRFSGLNYDNDVTAGTKLDNFIRRTQAILVRYEGNMLQLTMGDKGSYLYAVFGAPVAHEDDPARAVATALDLRHLATELDFIETVQIGISRGLMHAGAYGGQQRRTYGVLGREVNVAARLMNQAQPGQILVTQRVAEMAATAFQFHPLGEFTLKGMLTALPVYTVAGQKETQTAATLKGRDLIPMIGRDEQLATLVTQMENLQSDAPARCVIVEGEAGIGKSRLLFDLLAQADTVGQLYWLGTADAVDRATPYHVWRAILGQVFELEKLKLTETARLSDAWRQHIQHWLETADPDLLPLAPLLNAILPLDWPENELTQQMTGQVRATNTQELCVQILQHVTRSTPMILALEDSHWLDSASWALARLVYRDVPGLLMLLITRPMTDAVPMEYTFLRNGRFTHHIVLDTLPQPAIEAIVRNRLGVSTLPLQVLSLIQQKAAGHPFFSEELAISLQDSGVLEIANGRAQLAPGMMELRAVDFPDTIQGVITSRMDRLQPQHQLMLKVASVIGRVFAYQVLHNVHPIEQDKPRLPQYLQVMEQTELAKIETPEPDLAYIFKHVITQEVAYGLLLYAQRRQLHKAVAMWYEDRYRDDLSPYYSVLAHHWQHAIDQPSGTDTATRQAMLYMERAGQQALQNHANKEAAQQFAELLALHEQAGSPDGPVQAALWQQQLGFAYYALGQIMDARQQLVTTLAALGHPRPEEGRPLTLKLLQAGTTQLYHRLRPPSAVASSEERQILLEAARCYMRLSYISYFLNESNHLLHDSLAAINLLERVEPTPELIQAYSMMIIISGAIPNHRWAEGYGRLARNLLTQVDDQQAEASSHSRLSIYRTGAAKWEGLEGYFDKATIFRRIKDIRALGDSLIGKSHLYFFRSRFQAAAEVCQELHRYAVQYENRQHEAWGLIFEGRSVMMLGDAETAVTMIEQGAAMQGQQIGDAEDVINQGLLGLAHLRLGQWDKALEHADKGLVILERVRPAISATREGFIGPAYVYLWLWEMALVGKYNGRSSTDLQAAAQTACKHSQKYARVFNIGKPHAQICQGWFDWLAGKPKKATKQWLTAIKTAESLQMPYETGLAHWEIGRHLPAADLTRRPHLQQAHDIFQQVGATFDLGLVKREIE